MIAGHFGLAAAVKAREPQVPLWALMLATVWLDVVFGPLVVLGVEGITFVHGTSGGYGNAVISADYTHSLVGAAVIAAVFGLVAALPWGRRAGVVLAAVVFSHWLLDLVVHRGDMPILPGNAGDLPRLGFGLWEFTALSVVAELALVAGGSYLYWRAARRATADGQATRSADRLGRLVLAAGLATLGLDVLAG